MCTRHIFKYAKKIFGAHDAPLSSPWSDAGECIVYRLLKFQQCVPLEVPAMRIEYRIARVADVWHVDSPRRTQESSVVEADVFSMGVHLILL
jgi:hypothetical protein